MEDKLTFLVIDLLVVPLSSKDLCRSIFVGGFKLIEMVFCNSSLPIVDMILTDLIDFISEKYSFEKEAHYLAIIHVDMSYRRKKLHNCL